MADSNTGNIPQILGGNSNVSSDVNSNPSNILIGTDRLRNFLISRNLYNQDSQYPDNTSSVGQRLVDTVNAVSGLIRPFRSFDANNTIFGRLIGDRTPLTEIGSIMLAKQFAYNSASHIAQQNFPKINISNLFDGNENTKLFTKNINLKISKKRRDTFAEKFKAVGDALIFDMNSSDEYPFSSNPTNDEYLQATGEGQLNFLIGSINNNIYKTDNSTLIQLGDDLKKPIQLRSNLIALGVKTFFNFSDGALHPYLPFNASFFAEIPANQNMIDAYNITPNIQEYAPNKDYVKQYFGDSDNYKKFDLFSNVPNEWVDDEIDILARDSSKSLIWGKDGVSIEANKRIDKFRGDKDQVGNDFNNEFDSTVVTDYSYSKFGIKSGLLEYTRNLINATEGRVGDLTRKAFTDDSNKVVAFNGSALWVANDSTYSQKAGWAGKKGVRQHSVVDQYDRFSKAIRYNGNEIYNGNPDSVIYKSVVPRIHPIFNTGNDVENIVDNKNLMFTIENLGVGVISDGHVGIIDDEWGSQIPICEVGPNKGRIMWFPPYNISLNETSSAKFDSTVMVGRGEPMYNYQNTERTATLSFSLLIDYPEHLRQFHNKRGQQRDIAEFFAFGGDPYTGNITNLDDIEKRINELQNEVTELENQDLVEPEPSIPPELKMVFPDAVPRTKDKSTDPDPIDDVNTVVDLMYRKFNYEIIEGLPSNYARYGIKDATSFALNKPFYVLSGITESGGSYVFNENLLPSDFTQYNQTGDCLFNDQLKSFYSDEEVRKYYDIVVYGGASKLYTENIATDIAEGEKYNKELGLRRANALIEFTKKRLAAIFDTTFEGLGITVKFGGQFNDGSNGDKYASEEGAKKNNMYRRQIKEERYAIVKIERNSVKAEKKKKQLSQDEEKTISDKKSEIESLRNSLQYMKDRRYDCVYNERTDDNAILYGFNSVSGNYYSPVFHSQTPEDFHKRLVFLHQCTRQGAAKRYDNKTGELTARNSVFGRQPICILRLGDFLHTKVVIGDITFDYDDVPWDMNPEGFGLQPMIANITLQMKVIGGQSLKVPIDAIQNAASFNYYANSTFTKTGLYKRPSAIADAQYDYLKGILSEKENSLKKSLKNRNDSKIKPNDSNSSENK